MGGLGSGNWYRWQGRKTTVEESLGISISDFRDKLCPGIAGSFTWTSRGGNKSSIGYRVSGDIDNPVINLTYRWRDSEDIHFPVHLTTTPVHFGGLRFWFLCPLVANGNPCRRRVGKLYSPPGARYFGCRHCYDLTYRSSQEAHQSERIFARLGLDPEASRWLEKRGGLLG